MISRVVALVLVVSAAFVPSVQSASAQGTPATRIVDGRVVRPVANGGDSTGMGPAAGAWVTLHRVGRDSAGPMDSIRTSAEGRYRLQWRIADGDSAVFFASVTWDGIAYFSPPLRAAVSRDADAEISVFDATSDVFPLTVKGRHLIVGMPDSANMRTVIEVFELANDSVCTLVSADGPAAQPTWSVAIPSAARDVRATQGDVPQDAFAYANGRVSVFAPVAPGIKQVAFSYQLHNDDFPLQYRTEHGAVVFEVLMEDANGAVFGDGFEQVEAVTLENRRFSRYLSQDVVDGTPVTVEVPSTPKSRGFYVAIVLVALGFAALLAMTRGMQRRVQRGRQGNAERQGRVAEPLVPLHEWLAHEIVALDTMFARQTAPTESVRLAYDARRAELKAALSDALASGPQAG